MAGIGGEYPLEHSLARLAVAASQACARFEPQELREVAGRAEALLRGRYELEGPGRFTLGKQKRDLLARGRGGGERDRFTIGPRLLAGRTGFRCLWVAGAELDGEGMRRGEVAEPTSGLAGQAQRGCALGRILQVPARRRELRGGGLPIALRRACAPNRQLGLALPDRVGKAIEQCLPRREGAHRVATRVGDLREIAKHVVGELGIDELEPPQERIR